MVAIVGCRNAVSGATMDAAFRITVMGDGVLTGHLGSAEGFFGHSAVTRVDGNGAVTTPGGLGWTSGPGSSYTLQPDQVAGDVEHVHDADLSGAFTAHVTRREGGSTVACQFHVGGAASTAYNCWDKLFPPDAQGRIPRVVHPHYAIGFEAGRNGQQWGYALVSPAGNARPGYTRRNPSGGVDSHRFGPGKYRVTFPGMGDGTEPAILVTPWSNGDFRVCSTYIEQLSPDLKIDVACWNQHADFVDTEFSLAFLR